MCGFAGRAVNPSMGAREPHPCGTTVPPTHTPHASDGWLVAMEMKSRCRAERIPAGLNAPSRASHARQARQASLARQARHARAGEASRQVKASEANRQTSTLKHARAPQSTPKHAKARQSTPKQRRHQEPALSLRTSPLSKGGHGWVGGTMCCHGWQHMSLHGRTCSGSRQPTRACPARHEPAHPLLTYCPRCCCAEKGKKPRRQPASRLTPRGRSRIKQDAQNRQNMCRPPFTA